jgi:hypothetical protein
LRTGRQLGLAGCERVLELVVGELLELRKVPLGDQLEIRLTVVVREALVDDLPARRLSVLDRAQRVAEPRSVGTKTPKAADLLASIRMLKPDAIARRLCESVGDVLAAVGFDALDQPVATLEPDHVARRERVVRDIGPAMFLARARGRDNVVHGSHGAGL